jgi:O-acetyl-ADP-ribose deacetylase (regulator of RNase III)
MEINYLKGDATCPQTAGSKILAHICNDVGGWGKGYVLAISKRWKEPENEYRFWYNNRKNNNFALGKIQIVEVSKNLWVCNMVAQHGLGWHDGKPPIRYDALERCLIPLNSCARFVQASIHLPRIGCGLAGGKWSLVEEIIKKKLTVPVYVYDFGSQ